MRNDYELSLGDWAWPRVWAMGVVVGLSMGTGLVLAPA